MREASTYNGNNSLTALDYLFFNSMIGKHNEQIYSKDCGYELKKII